MAQEPTPEQTFQIHCSACHAVDQMVVGPSLVEISGLYQDKEDDFVKWCIEPQHKRQGAIEMPSMAHLGEETLRKLHGYVLSAASGKTEVRPRGGDPWGIPAAAVRRPQVQRIFMPDATPAAIAVALPGDLSFCFDATLCRLRYVWKGGFINGFPYWQGSGHGLARIEGNVVYREDSFPLTWTGSGEAKTKFLGYQVGEDGIPTFRYRIGDETWSETIRPLPDGSGVTREFTTATGRALTVADSKAAKVESSTGGSQISATASKSFTLTFRW